MYTFRINAIFATIHYLVSCWHFFNCGGNSERNVESLIMILFSSSLESLRPPSFVSLTRLLCSYLMDTWSNNFGTSSGSVWLSNIILRTLLEIGDWTTWAWRVIHAYRLRLVLSLIFKCPFHFFIGPQAISNFNDSVFWFCRFNMTDSSSIFNIKYVGE